MQILAGLVVVAGVGLLINRTCPIGPPVRKLEDSDSDSDTRRIGAALSPRTPPAASAAVCVQQYQIAGYAVPRELVSRFSEPDQAVRNVSNNPAGYCVARMVEKGLFQNTVAGLVIVPFREIPNLRERTSSGCAIECGPVYRPLQLVLQAYSKQEGQWAVVAREKIPAFSIVAPYNGVLMEMSERQNAAFQGDRLIEKIKISARNAAWQECLSELTLLQGLFRRLAYDAESSGNNRERVIVRPTPTVSSIAAMLNHSDTPNCELALMNSYGQGRDVINAQTFGKCMYTLRDIEQGEELTWNYRPSSSFQTSFTGAMRDIQRTSVHPEVNRAIDRLLQEFVF